MRGKLALLVIPLLLVSTGCTAAVSSYRIEIPTLRLPPIFHSCWARDGQGKRVSAKCMTVLEDDWHAIAHELKAACLANGQEPEQCQAILPWTPRGRAGTRTKCLSVGEGPSPRTPGHGREGRATAARSCGPARGLGHGNLANHRYGSNRGIMLSTQRRMRSIDSSIGPASDASLWESSTKPYCAPAIDRVAVMRNSLPRRGSVTL
jgi:hypothetical protein